MTAAAIHGFEVQASPEIVHHWGWFLAFGIGLLALGVAAVMRSVTATIVSMVFFGWLLVLASGIEIAQAVMVGNWAGFFQHLLAAILFGVAGLLIIVRPAVSAEVITMFMAMVLSDRRLIPTDRLDDRRLPRVGLAGSGWTHHLSPRPASHRRMARHRALGDRPFYRHQFNCLRHRLDRACTRPARKLRSVPLAPYELLTA